MVSELRGVAATLWNTSLKFQFPSFVSQPQIVKFRRGKHHQDCIRDSFASSFSSRRACGGARDSDESNSATPSTLYYHGTHTWAGIHADCWQYLDHGEREVFPCSQNLHCYRERVVTRARLHLYTLRKELWKKIEPRRRFQRAKARNEICYCSCSGFGFFLLHAQLAHGINVFWLITHSQRDINLGQGGQKVGLLNPGFFRSWLPDLIFGNIIFRATSITFNRNNFPVGKKKENDTFDSGLALSRLYFT